MSGQIELFCVLVEMALLNFGKAVIFGKPKLALLKSIILDL